MPKIFGGKKGRTVADAQTRQAKIQSDVFKRLEEGGVESFDRVTTPEARWKPTTSTTRAGQEAATSRN